MPMLKKSTSFVSREAMATALGNSIIIPTGGNANWVFDESFAKREGAYVAELMQADDGESSESRHILGLMYANGRGVPQDIRRAAELLQDSPINFDTLLAR